MLGFAKSTIAALCYAKDTEINFHAIASEMGQALWDNPHGTMNMHSQYDDFVIYDLPGLRICLAYTDLAAEFPDTPMSEHCGKLVMVSVGSAPEGAPGHQAQAVNASTHLTLVRNLSDHVARHARFDREIVLERDEVITEDIYDGIVAQILYESSNLGPPQATIEVEPAPVRFCMTDGVSETDSVSEEAEVIETTPGPHHRFTRATRLGPVPGERELDSFDARFEAECAARDAAQQARTAEYEAREAAEIAREAARDASRAAARRRGGKPASHRPSATPPDYAPAQAHSGRRAPVRPNRPGATHPAAAADRAGAAQMARFDLGSTSIHLRPSEIFDKDVDAQPLVHRAAVNALNASMVAFAMPVGAALLTMAVLGRESLGLSSRITALTGAYIGLTQGDGVVQLLNMLG